MAFRLDAPSMSVGAPSMSVNADREPVKLRQHRQTSADKLRIASVLTEQMRVKTSTISESCRCRSNCNYHAIFSVVDEEGHVFIVQIKKIPTCSCAEYCLKHEICKHIRFVYLREIQLEQSSYILCQRLLEEKELRAIWYWMGKRHVQPRFDFSSRQSPRTALSTHIAQLSLRGPRRAASYHGRELTLGNQQLPRRSSLRQPTAGLLEKSSRRVSFAEPVIASTARYSSTDVLSHTPLTISSLAKMCASFDAVWPPRKKENS
eukprot:m.230168 g.230168  ORF g.230168 m.230168 type:complete len:262 (-) comp17058_c4_seq1:2209-2994(-)